MKKFLLTAIIFTMIFLLLLFIFGYFLFLFWFQWSINSHVELKIVSAIHLCKGAVDDAYLTLHSIVIAEWCMVQAPYYISCYPACTNGFSLKLLFWLNSLAWLPRLMWVISLHSVKMIVSIQKIWHFHLFNIGEERLLNVILLFTSSKITNPSMINMAQMTN